MTLFAFASTLELSRIFTDCVTDKVAQSFIVPSVDGKSRAMAASLGVGLVEFSANLSTILLRQMQAGEPVTSVILVGICGAYKNSDLQIGDVVRVDSEVVGDLGVQQRDSSFSPWSQVTASVPRVYRGAAAESAPAWVRPLKSVRGLSVNCCTGTNATAGFRETLFGTVGYRADVESMEGAACFAIGKAFNVPVYQIRAVSNFVGDRDKSAWRIDEALENLRLLMIEN